MIREEEENILYELLVHAEWPLEAEVIVSLPSLLL